MRRLSIFAVADRKAKTIEIRFHGALIRSSSSYKLYITG